MAIPAVVAALSPVLAPILQKVLDGIFGVVDQVVEDKDTAARLKEGLTQYVLGAWNNELQAAMADGELYIGELKALDSLRVGTASKYEEQLHFGPTHRVPHTAISARGTLEDGSSFQIVVARETDASGDFEYEHVQIAFK